MAGRHLDYWRQQIQTGTALLVGRMTDEVAPGKLAPDTAGLILFRASDRKAARRLIDMDPGVQVGIWKYRFSSYRVALTSKELTAELAN